MARSMDSGQYWRAATAWSRAEVLAGRLIRASGGLGQAPLPLVMFKALSAAQCRQAVAVQKRGPGRAQHPGLPGTTHIMESGHTDSPHLCKFSLTRLGEEVKINGS